MDNITTFKVSGKTYDVPQDKLEAFKASFPDAIEHKSFIAGKDTFDIPITKVDAFLAARPDAKPTFGETSKVGTPKEESGFSLDMKQATQPSIMADGSETKPINALKPKVGTHKNPFLAHANDGMKADMREIPTGEDKLPEIKNALQNEVLNQNSKSLEDIGVKIPILANKEINPPSIETAYSNELIQKFTHNKKDMMLDNPNYRGQIAEQLSKKYNIPQPQIEDYITKLNDNKKEIRENLAEISLNPKNDKAYSSLGNNYFGIGEYDQAEKVYMAALSANPNSEGAKNGLGSVALAKKDYPTAVQIFTELSKTNPNTDNIGKLATAVYGTGDFKQAKQLADKAVTAGGDFPDSYALKIRATANAALGDNAASVADLKASKVAEDLATDQTVEYTNEKGQTQRITKRQQELDNEAQSLNAFVDVAHEVIQKGINIVPQKIVADAIMQIGDEISHYTNTVDALKEVSKSYSEGGASAVAAEQLARAARVGFSALAVYSPEVQKFMQQMQVGETILPSQAIGMVMQPISMLFTNEGTSSENKNWAQLADIPVSLLIFHGLNVGGKKGYERAVELGDKIKQNLPLTKNEFAEIADGFNGVTSKEVLAIDNNIAKHGTINTELSAVADSWKSLGEAGIEDVNTTPFEKQNLAKEPIKSDTTKNEITKNDTTETILEKAKGTIYEQLANAIKGAISNVKTTISDTFKSDVSEHGDYGQNEIRINNKTDKNKLHIFFHEAIHHITREKIEEFESNPNSKKLTPQEVDAILNLKRIFKKVTEDLNKKEGGYGTQKGGQSPTNMWILDATGNKRGLDNVHEFVSEAFSNPGFQKILKDYKGEGKEPTIFKQFLNAISKLLGIKDQTILDDIFYHTEKLKSDTPNEPTNPTVEGEITAGDNVVLKAPEIEQVQADGEEVKADNEKQLENANNTGLSNNETLKGNEGEVIADKESKDDKAGEGDGGVEKGNLGVPENQKADTQKKLIKTKATEIVVKAKKAIKRNTNHVLAEKQLKEERDDTVNRLSNIERVLLGDKSKEYAENAINFKDNRVYSQERYKADLIKRNIESHGEDLTILNRELKKHNARLNTDGSLEIILPNGKAKFIALDIGRIKAEVEKNFPTKIELGGKGGEARLSQPKRTAVGNYEQVAKAKRSLINAEENLAEAEKSGNKKLIEVFKDQLELEKSAHKNAESDFIYGERSKILDAIDESHAKELGELNDKAKEEKDEVDRIKYLKGKGYKEKLYDAEAKLSWTNKAIRDLEGKISDEKKPYMTDKWVNNRQAEWDNAMPEDIDNVIENIKNGNITEKQVEDYTQQDESVIADIERKAEDANEIRELEEGIKQADELVKSTSGTPKAEPKSTTEQGKAEEKVISNEKTDLQKALDAVAEEWNKAKNSNIAYDPKNVVNFALEKALLKLGKELIKSGVTKFTDFAKEIINKTKDFGEPLSEEHLRNLWNDAVNEKPLDEVRSLHAAQNATIEAKRKELGLDPMLSKLKTTAPKMLEEAINIIADGKVPDMVKKALQDNRFTFTAPEQIAIDHVRDQLHEEHLQLDKDLVAARKTNDINKVGDLESQRILKRLQIDEYDTVLRNTGTTSAQVLSMRRAYVDKQLTAATILSTMRADSKTGEVAKEYVKAIEDITNERDELIAKSKILEENIAEQKRINEQAQKDFEKELQEARVQQAQKSNKKEASKKPVDLAREAEKARLRKILGIGRTANALFNPENLGKKEFYQYHKMIFEDAVGDFRHFTKEMVKDFGSGVKQYLPKLFKDSGGTEEQINAAKKTDIELNGEFDILTKKAIVDADGEFHEGLKGILDKMFNNRVEAGETDYKKNVQSIYDALEPHIENLDKEKVGDLIGGYGDFKHLTEDPVKLLAAEGRRNLVLDAKLREVGKGVLPKRNGRERAKATQAEREKTTAIAKGIREQNLTPEPNEKDKAAAYATELESYHRSLERQIEDYDAEGKSGIKKERTAGIKKSEKFTDKKTKALEAERDRVKAIRDAVFKERTATELEKTVKRAKKLTDDIKKEQAKENPSQSEIDRLQKEKDLTDGEIGNLVNAILGERSAGQKKIDSLRKQIDDILNGIAKEKSQKSDLTDAEKQQVKALQDELKKAKIDAGLIDKPLTAEEKQLESLQNQLDDLYAGKVKETPNKKVDSAAVKELKDKIAAQKELMGLKAAKAEDGSGTINAIQKAINEINAEIEALNSGTFDKEQTPNTKNGVTNFKTVKEKPTSQLTEETNRRIRELEGERDALQEQKNNLLPQNIKDLALINKALINRNRRLSSLRETIKGVKNGTIPIDPKVKKKLKTISNDPNVKKAQKELDDTNTEIKKRENELYAIKEEHRLLNRSTFEMFVDKINDFTRDGAISRFTAIPKILNSGVMTQMFRPIENLVGVASKYMMPKSVRSTATMEGQPYSLNAEAAVGKLISPNSWKEGVRKFKTGGHRQDFLYGEKIIRNGKSTVRFMGKTYSFYDPMSVFGRSHALAKTPGYMAGYERNLRYARENAMAFHPEYFDSNNQLTPEAARIIEKAAHEFALADAMLQPNALAKSVRGGIHRMENSKKFISRAGAKIGTNIFKVLNVSANYFSTQLEYIPLAGTLKAYAKLLDKGEMTPEMANDILRSNKRGVTGLGLFLTGMAFPQVFSGFDDKDDSGNIKIGEYEIPHWASHLPFFMSMQLGSTLRHYMDSDPSDKHAFETLKNTVDGIINQNPFAYTAHSFIHAIDSKTKASEFLYNEMFGQLIPQAAKEIGEWRDKDLSGETIKRQAHKINNLSDAPKFISDMTRLASGINRNKVGISQYQPYKSENPDTQKSLNEKGISIKRLTPTTDKETGKTGIKVMDTFVPLTDEQFQKVDALTEKYTIEEVDATLNKPIKPKVIGSEVGKLKEMQSIETGYTLGTASKELAKEIVDEIKERSKERAMVKLGYITSKYIISAGNKEALKKIKFDEEKIKNLKGIK